MVNSMESAAKSSRICRILVLLPLMALASCADTAWPTWLTGEPGPEVVDKPRAVIRPPSLGSPAWPNLADVPQQPVVPFSSASERSTLLKNMERERRHGEDARQSLDSVPAPALLSPPYSE